MVLKTPSCAAASRRGGERQVLEAPSSIFLDGPRFIPILIVFKSLFFLHFIPHYCMSDPSQGRAMGSRGWAEAGGVPRGQAPQGHFKALRAEGTPQPKPGLNKGDKTPPCLLSQPSDSVPGPLPVPAPRGGISSPLRPVFAVPCPKISAAQPPAHCQRGKAGDIILMSAL